jgi:hypothetical protein
MRLNKKTKWADVLPVWNVASNKEQVKADAVKLMFGDAGFYALTINNWIALTEQEDFTLFERFGKESAIGVLCVESFKNFVTDFIATLEKLTPPARAVDVARKNATLPCGVGEGFLIFARDYFCLHSFTEAGEITLADLILAKKDAYNNVMASRAEQNYNKQNTRTKR